MVLIGSGSIGGGVYWHYIFLYGLWIAGVLGVGCNIVII